MTAQIPTGVKQVRKRLADGTVKIYWYHRATGQRIDAEAGTAEALLQVRQLDDQVRNLATRVRSSKTFADLWSQYVVSPAFTELKPRTQQDYHRVRNWLGAGAEAAVLIHLTPPQIVSLRDKAFSAHKQRFANYVVQVVRLVLEWGRERGWMKDNPATGIKALPRKKGKPHQNRAWTDDEVRALLSQAPSYLKLPSLLALSTSIREGDMISLTWRNYDGHALQWIASKNDERCIVPITGLLKAELDRAKRVHVKMCLHSGQLPWASEDSFRSAFFSLVRKLQGQGLIGPNATFHGLRHTVGAVARDEGRSEFEVAAALGDRSTAMAQVYGRDADRKRAQADVLTNVQKRLENISMETDLETKPVAPKRKPTSD